jgi:hypothetical protein
VSDRKNEELTRGAGREDVRKQTGAGEVKHRIQEEGETTGKLFPKFLWDCLTVEDWADRLSLTAYRRTNIHHATRKKREDLIFTAAKALKFAQEHKI